MERYAGLTTSGPTPSERDCSRPVPLVIRIEPTPSVENGTFGPKEYSLKFALFSLALAVASYSGLASGADVNAGKAGYAMCLACHGADAAGNKALNAPALAAMPQWYVERQLNNYKLGVRGTNPKDMFGAQMRPMAMILTTDTAVANVSAYVASLPRTTAAPSLGGDASKGKAQYAVCTACHGASGEGNKALNVPPLAGQHDWYIARQLTNFKSGVRGTHAKDSFGAQMRPMAMVLQSEQAIKDVSAYASSLPGK